MQCRLTTSSLIAVVASSTLARVLRTDGVVVVANVAEQTVRAQRDTRNYTPYRQTTSRRRRSRGNESRGLPGVPQIYKLSVVAGDWGMDHSLVSLVGEGDEG